MIDQLIKGLCYTLTIISTFRATSRIKYILQNNKTIGLLDGPYITQPNVTLDDADVGLWEAVYTFQEAVKLSDRDGPYEVVEDVMNENHGRDDMPYSLSPYSTYSVRDKTIIQENQTKIPSKRFTRPSFPSYQAFKQMTNQIKHKVMKKEDDELNLPPRTIKLTKKIKIPLTNHTAKITSYAIPMFRTLRNKFLNRQDSEEYFRDKMANDVFKSFVSNSKGAARAGMFYFL